MADRLRQAVILAGGPGVRLRPLTNDRPKAMVEVNGRPFIEYLLDLLKENGIEEVILLLGYLPHKITEHLGDGSKFGIKIKYSIGTVDDFTGTRLRMGQELFDDVFLLMYCDNYIPLNLKKLLAFHEKEHSLATVLVYTNKDKRTKDNVLVSPSGHMAKYDRSRLDPRMEGVELGFFIMHKKALDFLPKDGNVWFEDTLLPALIERKELTAYLTDHPYYSAGDIPRLKITGEFLKPKKVIFLDRDGVINKRMAKGDYVKKWSEFEFLPGAIEAMKLLTDRGYDIYIISNQAGIARGVMTEADLGTIHKNMEVELAKHGVAIAGIYHCPHAWDAGCECRKPKPGMLYQAARDHLINLTRTYFIGDDERDAEAGEAAGCKTILVGPDHDLLKAVRSTLATSSAARRGG